MKFTRLFTLHKLMLLAAAALLSACSAFGPRTVTISEVQLAELIAGQFPVQRRLLDFFDLTLDAPQLRLLPAHNRLATRFDFILGMPALGTRLKGMTSLSYGLRYEHADDTIRLADVRLEEFQVPGLSEVRAPQVRQLVGLKIGELLNDRIVYRMSDRNRALIQRANLQPGQVSVTHDGLALALDKKE